MKKLFIIFVFAFSLILTAVAASASTSKISDNDNVISSAEESRIEQAFATAERETSTSFYALISREITGYSADQIRDHLGISSSESAAVLLVECNPRSGEWFYELFLFGKADKNISRETSDAILDDPTLRSGIKDLRLADGIVRFAELTADALKEARGKWIRQLIIITVCGALAGAIIPTVIVIVKYKKKLRSPIYSVAESAELDLSHSEDLFVRSYVDRRRVSSASSSGGRGGSRGGGGGGSRGRR